MSEMSVSNSSLSPVGDIDIVQRIEMVKLTIQSLDVDIEYVQHYVIRTQTEIRALPKKRGRTAARLCRRWNRFKKLLDQQLTIRDALVETVMWAQLQRNISPLMKQGLCQLLEKMTHQEVPNVTYERTAICNDTADVESVLSTLSGPVELPPDAPSSPPGLPFELPPDAPSSPPGLPLLTQTI